MSVPLRQFADLPEQIQDFLVSPNGFAWVNEIQEKFKLSEGKATSLSAIVEEILLGKESLEFLPSAILSELGVDWEVACQFAVDLAGHRLLPIASFLDEDIKARIREWGGDPAAFKDVPRVEIPKEDPAEVVGKVLEELKINLSDHLEQSRLEFILTSMVNGLRTKEETLAAFVRPVKVGGLNMAPEDAKGLLERFLQKVNLSAVKPEVKKELPKKTPVMTDIKPPPVRPVPVPASISSYNPTPLPSAPLREGEGQGVRGERMEGEGQGVRGERMEGEGQGVKSKKTNEAEEREKQQTEGRQINPSPPMPPPPAKGADVGGGENKLEIEDIVKQIEAKANLKLDEATRKKFVGAVEARLKDIRDAFETRDLLERSVEQGGLAIGGGQLALVMEELEKIVGEQQTVARIKFEEEKKTAKAAAKVVAEKAVIDKAKAVRPKIGLPKPVTPVVSPASRSLPPSNGRPLMVDVVAPSRRLSGPIEELQNLSLEEFRRLSSDPKEAIIKIHDKINLLEEQGIGQKILAVKAWRSSPINLLYLEISRAALLSGRVTEDVARERVLANQPSLTNEEIHAINSLNGMLRF